MMTPWRTTAGLAVLAGTVASVGASAAPQLKSSWRSFDPSATPVSRVIVIGFTTEQATRRVMEDSLTAEIRKHGGTAEPSYTIVPGALPKEPAAMKEKVTAAGFDGAVVVRVAGVRQEQAWDPGYSAVIPTSYGTVWTYWGYWGPYAWDIGYLRTDTVVRIEIVAYAVGRDIMLWTGLSESTNPGSVRKLIQQVAVSVGADLKKRNVIR
jgi:hypothetical protein